MLMLSVDGTISRFDGFALVSLLVMYMTWSVRASRKETKAVKDEYAEAYGEPEKKPMHSGLALGFVIMGLVALMFHYVAYVVYLVLTATQHAALKPFTLAMMVFILPLTTITMGVIVIRELRARSKIARSTDPTRNDG